MAAPCNPYIGTSTRFDKNVIIKAIAIEYVVVLGWLGFELFLNKRLSN